MVSQNKSWTSIFWAIFLSAFIALVLTVVPLSTQVFYFWPDWIAMVMVYWALSLPDRVGPWIGFIVGIVMEVLFVRNFGVLGFGMAVLAFMVNRASSQLQALSPWQQSVIVGLLIGIYKLITGWLNGLISDFTISTEYWYSLLGDMLLWPFVFILLRELRRMARLT
jgi:rod shape-determining protein MreD